MSGGVAQRRKKVSFLPAGRAKARPLQLDPALFTPHFSWKKAAGGSDDGASVYCEGMPLSDIAERAGTPAYVYSQAGIGDAYMELDSELSAFSTTRRFSV